MERCLSNQTYAAFILFAATAVTSPAQTFTSPDSFGYASQALKYSVIHTFQGGFDGSRPAGPVTVGPNGVLYGTTFQGQNGADGTVFSLTPPVSGGAWTETTLWNFNGTDGENPCGNIILGKRGVLYGITNSGGYAGNSGAVYSLTPPSTPGNPWNLEDLWTFTPDIGYNPGDGLMLNNGVLYGTTLAYSGTVYSLAPPASSGGSWIPSEIYSFYGSAYGDSPYGGLVAANGVLFGTTEGGGAANPVGDVFSLTPDGNGTWSIDIIHTFTGPDGANPASTMVLGEGGVLFGTTTSGGLLCDDCGCSLNGCGTVFSLTPPSSPGGVWTEAVLYEFPGGEQGQTPNGVVLGPGGVIYGTTSAGGKTGGGGGTVFSLAPPTAPGAPWVHTVLHAFNIYSRGTTPMASVTVGAGGIVFGTAQDGGELNEELCPTGCGVVFALEP